ncbi:MAG: nuclear transport factor 2 family protein [Tahibacter sp.]
MKKLIATVLLASLFNTAACAASSPASPVDASAVDAVKQLGQVMGDAMIARDVDKLDRIFGDDWVTIGLAGNVYTKEALLRDIKAGKNQLVWFDMGPMDVRIFGDVAIVQGDVTEKRINDGQEHDSKAIYSDILKMRDGHWVVVRSMGAALK